MCILTCLAGAVNAISIFGYDGTTVSHLTGLVSKVAINITEGSFEGVWEVLRVILLFFLGAVVSGFITGERAFYLHKRYGFIIIAIGVLIFIPYFLPIKYGVLVFAFVMGLQNGMVVSFKGVVVRMTHMSGNVTDLAVFLGYKLRGNKNEAPITGIIPFLAIVSFFVGGIVAVCVYKLIFNVIFFIISGIYILLSIVYLIFRQRCIDKDFNGIPDELEKDNKKIAQ
jgi:uncharacterized membrane protein YoaK (UPF0700 family)